MILGQLAIGLVIGYISFIVMAIMQYAGEVLDTQMGLSVAASFDPASRGAVNMIRRFEFYLAMILYLIMDGHHQLLDALHKSFIAIPVSDFHMGDHLIWHLARTTGGIFEIGIQIAAPVLAALFITQVALGLLARVAPQMNVFMLSFPLNIAIGLGLLATSLILFPTILRNLFDANYGQTLEAIKYMMPGR